MGPSTMQVEPGKLIITRRQNSRSTWWLCIPLALYLTIPAIDLYRFAHPSRHHHTDPVMGFIFFSYIFIFGLPLVKTMTAKSRLTIEGARLSILRGSLGRMEDLGNYADGVLSDLSFEPRRSAMRPAGTLTARVGSVPLVLAECLNDKDGNELKELLARVYHFEDSGQLASRHG